MNIEERIDNYLNEGNKLSKNDIQKIVDKITKKENVDAIKINTTDKNLQKGSAYYKTRKIKGGKINFPEYIKIGEWANIKKYPDELAYVLAHELAHHVLNMKKNSLGHTKMFYKKTKEIENRLLKLFGNNKEKDELKKKIDYWQKHREEIESQQKEINSLFNFDKELNKMKQKLKNGV